MSIGDSPKDCPSPESRTRWCQPARRLARMRTVYCGSLLRLCRAVSEYGSRLVFTNLLPVELTF
jgi:hypothetical protein